MSSRRILAVVTGFGALLGTAALAVLPVQAAPVVGVGAVSQAGPGWHKIGVYDHFTCFQKANWYQDNGARDTRCDDIGGGRSELWVLTDE
ncbi:hypothetical protein [Kribbella flavida]|nr:hypothetical protein [Kribbella flavida]